MDPTGIGFLGCGVLLILVIIGMPIAFASALVGFLGIALLNGLNTATQVVGYLPHPLISHYTMTVIPLFIVMGYFAMYGGLTQGLFSFGRAWAGHAPGGLAISTIFSCAAFGACTGSSVATAAIMSRVALPEMRQHGYDAKMAAGVVAASGTLAVLIPPSVTMAIYGFLTEQSIGALLIAGILPGIVSAIIYMGMIYLRCRVNPSIAPVSPRASWKARFRTLKEVWILFVVVALILGGIYTGVFTPTEAGAAAAFIVFVFALLRKRLGWTDLRESLLATGRTTCMIFLVVLGILLFTNFLALSGVTDLFIKLLIGLPFPRFLKLVMILSIYIVLGMFMEIISMLALTLPIILPVIIDLGFDTIWFGIIVVKMAEVCLITPPIGINVYVVHDGAPDIPLESLFRGIVPFLLMDILTIALLTVFPQITTFLPSKMMP